MDAAMLKTFPRKKVQDLAKKHGVKANLKTDLIIALLVKKNPNGVPSGQSQSAKKGQTKLKTFQQRRSTRLSASARPQAPQPAAHPVAIPEHERSSASIVYDEVRSTVSSNSSPEHNRSSPLPILDEDSAVGPLHPLVERRDGPSTTTSGTQSDHHREEPISPEVPHETPRDYTTQVDEFLDSIAAAQSVAGPSRLPAVQYTPNGRHVITDDPQNPIRPRVFYLPGDPNQPSNQALAPHEAPGYPHCADGRHYSRECAGYMDEENDIDNAIEDIIGIFNLAEKERKIAQEKLLEVRAIRLVLERECLPQLKPRSQLYNFDAYVQRTSGSTAGSDSRVAKRKRYPIDGDDDYPDVSAASKRMRS